MKVNKINKEIKKMVMKESKKIIKKERKKKKERNMH